MKVLMQRFISMVMSVDERRGAMGRLLARIMPLCVSGLLMAGVGAADASSTVPFTEPFTYPDGISLDGTNGWGVSGAGSAIVSTNRARLQDIALANAFSPVENAVTVTYDLQPTFTSVANPWGLFPAGATARFFVKTNGLITAYDGSSPTNLTHTPLSETNSTQIQVRIDYPMETWALAVGGVDIATNLAICAGNAFSRFKGLHFKEGSTNTFSYVDNVSVAAATTASSTVLPFIETFDNLDAGDISGQHGWAGTASVVQGDVVFQGSKACSITGLTGEAAHTFSDGQTNVWTDLYMKPVFGRAPSVPADRTVAFYVGTNGLVTAFGGGTTQTQLTHTVLVEGNWVRFTWHSHYAATNWDLWVNGQSAATGLGFHDTAGSSYKTFSVRGGKDAVAYLDNVRIGLKDPLSTGSVLIVR